ncbi:MAG TPA: membrane protein insertion efficiency factor YidD [Candidatus Paceibacterota bacterium]|nr:membrane protein insertion efficiency factor YidD [Candidatus Paceibacterota bacterium]
MPFYRKLIRKIAKIPNYIALGIIAIYRKVFSPTVGFLRYIPGYPKPSCIFYPTCSEYGMECFKKYPFWKALYKTSHRISRCHPGNEPGVNLP